MYNPQINRKDYFNRGFPGRRNNVLESWSSLLEPEKFRERYRLYFYAVRYLLERISWLIRDSHNSDKWGGDGTVKLVFSNRQGMSYEEMRDYLRLLKKQQKTGQDIRIDFEKVPIDKLSSRTLGKSMGLQLADATAGVFFNAIEHDKFGNTEPRYIQILKPIIYRNERIINGYGFKIVPREAMPVLIEKDSLKWLSEIK